MKRQVLEDVLYIGVFAVLLIPLLGTSNLAFPFITEKAFAFRILVEILGGIWLLLALFDKRYRPTFSGISIALISFLGITIIADMFGANPSRSFWSDFERMDGLVGLLHFALYFFILGTVLTTKKKWDQYFKTSIGVSGIVCLFGLLQLAGGMRISTDAGRIDSTFGNAAYLATYLMLNIFLIIFMLVRWQGKVMGKYVYVALLVLHAFILYFTATRSAMLGLLGGLGVGTLLIAVFGKGQAMLRKVAVGVLLGIIVLVGSFVFLRNQSFIQESPILNRFATLSLSNIKNETRVVVWSMALEGFKEHPILGWGQEQFRTVFLKYYHPSLYYDEIMFDRSHNIFLERLVAGGVLGLLVYIALFVTALYYLWFSKRGEWSVIEKSILTGFLAGYAINGLFLFETLASSMLFFAFLAYVFSQTLPISKDAPMSQPMLKRHEKEIGQKLKIAVIPVAIGAIFVMYVVNGKAILAATALGSALRTQSTTSEQSLEDFMNALSFNSFGQQNIRQELALAATNIQSVPNTTAELHQRYFENARVELEKQIQKMPDDAHLHYLLGSLLYSFGRYDEALSSLEQARELSPQKQVILLKQREVYMTQKEYQKAYEISKQVYELDPSFDIARNIYALNAILVNDTEIASTLLIEKYGTDTPFEPIIIQAYADSKQYEKLIELYTKRIAEKPDDMQTRISLAAVYVQAKQNQKAIDVLNDAIAYDPAFREIGEYWLREIWAGRLPE